MKELIQMRLEGFMKPMARFHAETGGFAGKPENLTAFQERVEAEMAKLGFDTVEEDSLGTVYGTIRGVEAGEDLVVVTHMDDSGACASSALYAAGAIKSSLLPLRGNLVVCCVPRTLFGNYAIEHFYEEVLKHRPNGIKGFILSEPTGSCVNLGHKGRVEYEIVVRGHVAGQVLQKQGTNMLGTIFPLVNELEKVSASLPHDLLLGHSTLRIKDIQYNSLPDGSATQEFRVAVDRVFVPEESPTAILARARAIASSVYQSCTDLDVSTSIMRSTVKTSSGTEEAVNEMKPWVMAGYHPFVLSSMEALKEAGFHASFGHWKRLFTEGSFTCGKLGLPTLGFGPGDEEEGRSRPQLREIERAALGQALIIHRNIGIPSFGWDADEI